MSLPHGPGTVWEGKHADGEQLGNVQKVQAMRPILYFTFSQTKHTVCCHGYTAVLAAQD